MKKRHSLVLLGLLALAASAHADDVRVYRPGEAVNPEDVARMLGAAPAAQKSRGLKSRGVSLITEDSVKDEGGGGQAAPAAGPAGNAVATAPAAAPAPKAAQAIVKEEPAAPSAFAVPIPFALNSAELQPEAIPALDAIAAGIRLAKSEGRAMPRLVIEGHTDASGSAAYNEALSRRRAEAVRIYLQAKGIDGALLESIGMGQKKPLNPKDPYAAENRRVQFRVGA